MANKKLVFLGSQAVYTTRGSVDLQWVTKQDYESYQDPATANPNPSNGRFLFYGVDRSPTGHAEIEVTHAPGSNVYEKVYSMGRYGTPDIYLDADNTIDDTDATVTDSGKQYWLRNLDVHEFASGTLKIHMSGSFFTSSLFMRSSGWDVGGTTTINWIEAIVSGGGNLWFEVPFKVERV